MARIFHVELSLTFLRYLLYRESRAALSEREKAEKEREIARTERKCKILTIV